MSVKFSPCKKGCGDLKGEKSLSITHARLQSLAVANPPHIFKQDDVLKAATRIFADRSMALGRLKAVFENTGIKQRHSICPMDWFEQPHGWKQRNDIYLQGATQLFRKVGQQALDQAGLAASDITTIVTVSSTGIATPTIEARAMAEMGFSPQTCRVPVFGLGCAGGVTGLSIASRLATADPRQKVLLVIIELCTLSFQQNELTKSNIIATALFGDGAAAAVISKDSKNAICEIENSGEHTWPQTLNIMGWRIEDSGMGAVFDRSIPQLVRDRLGQAVDGFLANNNLQRRDIDNFIFHPGGTRVLQALEETFELDAGHLKAERAVLALNGNMSAPTVMFVLRENIKTGLSGRSLVSALGPGFSSSFATLVA
jgi:alkylresorcinol/alkylpyrone synthase